jgi:hypothetical protein
MQYLGSRREGMFDWIVFHRPTSQDASEIAAQIGLDPSKPVIGCSPTCRGRAAALPANAFPNMLEWLVQTCEYFATRPDLQLLYPLRDHRRRSAASRRRGSRFLVELRNAPPASGAGYIHRRAAGKRLEHLRADVALQLGDHLRHEDGRRADERRIARHRAAKPWIRNKGITLDASSPRSTSAARAVAVRGAACRRRSSRGRGDTRITSSSTG